MSSTSSLADLTSSCLGLVQQLPELHPRLCGSPAHRLALTVLRRLEAKLPLVDKVVEIDAEGSQGAPSSSLSVFVSAIEESLRNVRLLLLAFLEVFARVRQSIGEQCSASAPEPEAPTERQALLDALPVKRELQSCLIGLRRLAGQLQWAVRSIGALDHYTVSESPPLKPAEVLRGLDPENYFCSGALQQIWRTYFRGQWRVSVTAVIDAIDTHVGTLHQQRRTKCQSWLEHSATDGRVDIVSIARLLDTALTGVWQGVLVMTQPELLKASDMMQALQIDTSSGAVAVGTVADLLDRKAAIRRSVVIPGGSLAAMSSKPRLLSSLHLLGAAAFADVPDSGGLVVEFAEGCDVVAEVLRGGGDGPLVKALMGEGMEGPPGVPSESIRELLQTHVKAAYPCPTPQELHRHLQELYGRRGMEAVSLLEELQHLHRTQQRCIRDRLVLCGDHLHSPSWASYQKALKQQEISDQLVHLRKKALLRHESEAGASREAVSHIRVLLHEVEAAEEASEQLRSKLVAEEQQWILKEQRFHFERMSAEAALQHEAVLIGTEIHMLTRRRLQLNRDLHTVEHRLLDLERLFATERAVLRAYDQQLTSSVSEKEALVCSLNKAVLRSREEARLAEAKTREKETLLAELLSFESLSETKQQLQSQVTQLENRLDQMQRKLRQHR
ncbi:unnamed protein product [Vitrella brassicaformis CCMP3155]|uniref:Uncharacterized protein n=3 Tax=Vitrella brassicaformis TaxID=1169539 RepID=A0A0G4EMK3_VITBC|nr:unnamed protein product [Vitrella brassicaformis CCMP3155]|eukprot:CEL98038.1 unnamed protein product [Vitrella brassicaformis CCMP3155]